MSTSSIYEKVCDNPKVPATLRIGIAGPRKLSDEQYRQSSAALATVINNITEVTQAILLVEQP